MHVIERLPDGCFNLDDARVLYIRWLRDPERRTARSKVDSDFVKANTELIAIRVREKKRELMETSEAMEAMELLMRTVLVAMGGMAARIAGGNMDERRRIDQIVFETLVKLANQFNEFANKA